MDLIPAPRVSPVTDIKRALDAATIAGDSKRVNQLKAELAWYSRR